LLGAEPLPAERDALRRRLAQRTETLCARIRQGDADTGHWREAVLAHVRRTVTDKLAVANPKFLGGEPVPADAANDARAR